MRARLSGAVLALTLLASACGSDAGPVEVAETEPLPDQQDEPTNPATVADGSGELSAWMSDAATWMEERIKADEVDVIAIGYGMETAGREGTSGLALAFLTRCEVLGRTTRHLSSAPDAPGDVEIDPLWTAFVDAEKRRWEVHRELCAVDPRTIVSDDTTPALDPVWEAVEQTVAACDEVLRVLEVRDGMPVARCSLASGQGFDEAELDLPEPLASWGEEIPPDEELLIEDVACDEPAGFDVALLPAGGCVVSWFGPAFATTNVEEWFVLYSVPGIGLFADEFPPENGASTIEMILPIGIADPAAPVEETALDSAFTTIPVPDDLTVWAEQMPLISTSSEMTIGGLPATYWVFEFDREATGSSVIVAKPPDENGGYVASLDLALHLWHIKHPQGAIFVFEQQFLADGRPVVAPNMFEFLEFAEL